MIQPFIFERHSNDSPESQKLPKEWNWKNGTLLIRMVWEGVKLSLGNARRQSALTKEQQIVRSDICLQLNLLSAWLGNTSSVNIWSLFWAGLAMKSQARWCSIYDQLLEDQPCKAKVGKIPCGWTEQQPQLFMRKFLPARFKFPIR